MQKYVKFTGWNRYARRFVKAPSFSWEPVENAVKYRIGIAAASDRRAVWFETKEPSFDFRPFWETLPFGSVSMLTLPLDDKGREVYKPCYEDNASAHAFIKSPGWKGGQQPPLDWESAIKRNMAYLLKPAQDGVDPFENELPRHLWSAIEDSYTGVRHFLGEPGSMNAYPTLHFPIYITAFLNFARQFPGEPLAGEARKQARQYGEWLLKNHHPYDYACSGFPYSCIAGGKLEEHSPTGMNNITVCRVPAVAEVMLRLGEALGNNDYSKYAKHIGDVLLKIQRADGSWPFRIDAKTGKVVDEYTSNVVTPARLLALLYRKTADETYRAAKDQAIRWLFANPVRTFRWEAHFEDVSAQKPYANLENWDVNETIRYLVYFKDELKGALSTAKQLNEFIEDQFILWDSEDPVAGDKCPCPLAMEQYACYAPMEAHTGNWILSLISLHSATGERDYLDKAISAANAICRGQHAEGAFSTWPYDERFQRPLRPQIWFGCNALALKALIKLNAYLKSVESGQPAAPDLGEW